MEKINKENFHELIETDNLVEIFYLISIMSESKLEQLIKEYSTEIKKPNNKIKKILKDSKDLKEFNKNFNIELEQYILNILQDTKDKLSQKRKAGLDTRSENLEILKIKPKLKLFKATKNKKDLYKIIHFMDEINSSLDKKKIPEKEEESEVKESLKELPKEDKSEDKDLERTENKNDIKTTDNEEDKSEEISNPEKRVSKH